MRDIDQLLRETAASVEYPETPDRTAAIRARIEASRRGTRFASMLSQRQLVAVAATLALAALAALATPGVRAAVLRFFHIGGVRVERVEHLPAVPLSTPLQLGQRVPLQDAQRRVDFRVREPKLHEAPTVYVHARTPRGGQISFLVGTPARPRLLLTEFRGSGTRIYANKIVGPGTRVELLRVNGASGMWISGKPHAFHFIDRNGDIDVQPLRLAANTLLWEEDGITYRLEARVAKREALKIAATLDDED